MAKTKIQKKPVFLLQNPATNSWRSECFLGVAFTNGIQAFDGEWAPEGPVGEEAQAEPTITGIHATSTTIKETPQNLGLYASVLATTKSLFSIGSSSAKQEASPTHPPSSALESVKDIQPPTPTVDHLVTKWPKDIVPEIYSKDALVEAVDAETVLERNTDHNVNAWLKDLIGGKFRWSSTNNNTTTMPVFKRIAMQRPVEKIRRLLQDPVYRDEMFKLFGLLEDGDKKILWVASQILVCGNMSKETLKKSSVDMGAGIKDPTDTIPIKVDGELKWVKSATLKGTYTNEMIVGMVYRTIEYKELQKEGIHISLKKNEPKWDVVVEENKSGFYISKSDAKGQSPPFMGEEEVDDDDRWAFDDLVFRLDAGGSDSEAASEDDEDETEDDVEDDVENDEPSEGKNGGGN